MFRRALCLPGGGKGVTLAGKIWTHNHGVASTSLDLGGCVCQISLGSQEVHTGSFASCMGTWVNGLKKLLQAVQAR